MVPLFILSPCFAAVSGIGLTIWFKRVQFEAKSESPHYNNVITLIYVTQTYEMDTDIMNIPSNY